MRSPIELELLFKKNVTQWQKVIDRKISDFKKSYSYLSAERVDQIVLSRLERRLERLVGIWDRNHQETDGFRKNNYLVELFADLENAKSRYRISTFGNFFKHDYPSIKARHQKMLKTHQNWYAYRKQAFEWNLDDTILWCSLYFTLRARTKAYKSAPVLSLQEANLAQPTTKSLASKIRSRSGQMNGVEVAVFLGKSPSTITRLVKLNKIPHQRRNGKAVFNLNEIEEWLKNE